MNGYDYHEYDYRCHSCGAGLYADVGMRGPCPHCRGSVNPPERSYSSAELEQMMHQTEATLALMGVDVIDKFEMLKRLIASGDIQYDNKVNKYYWTKPKKKYFR